MFKYYLTYNIYYMLDNGKINRPDQMTPFSNIVKGAEKVGVGIAKEGLKDIAGYAPTVGSALGGVLGAELGPEGVAVGSWIGKKTGNYAKAQASKLIDKL